MSPFDRPRVLDLYDGELVRCGQPMRLRVLAGRVWLTRAHDLDDHFLAAGDAVRLAPAWNDLVGAEGAARIELVPDTAARRGLRAAAAGVRRLVRRAFTMAAPLLGRRSPWTSPPTSSP
jgi:hypothetical protein